MYYVYRHIHPESKELLYIGYGHKDRAWRMGNHKTRLRNVRHTDALDKLIDAGFIPADWVQIVARGLTKDSAYEMEQNLIKAERPAFNISQQEAQTKITKEQYDKMVSMREAGEFYKTIAEALGVGMMTVWNHLNKASIYKGL